MIGRVIEARRRPPWLALALLAAGFALGGLAAWRREPTPAAWAVLPLAMGGCLLALARQRGFTAQLGEDAILLGDERDPLAPPTPIPYASLRSVHADGWAEAPAAFRKPRATLAVRHEGGVLLIPPRLNVASAEVYRHLARFLPRAGGRDVNPALESYLKEHERRHGPGEVICYKAAATRARPAARRSTRAIRALLAGVVLAGLIWVGIGLAEWPSPEWKYGGAVALIFGSIFWLASFTSALSTPRVPEWRKASLVVGPDGLAMVQGPVRGEIRWEELLDLKFAPRPRSFRLVNDVGLAGIRLRVPGATITIADIYECPLYVIYDEILRRVPDRLRPAATRAESAGPTP